MNTENYVFIMHLSCVKCAAPVPLHVIRLWTASTVPLQMSWTSRVLSLSLTGLCQLTVSCQLLTLNGSGQAHAHFAISFRTAPFTDGYFQDEFSFVRFDCSRLKGKGVSPILFHKRNRKIESRKLKDTLVVFYKL